MLKQLLLVLIIVQFFFFSCSQSDNVNIESDIIAINEIYDKSNVACSTGDFELYLSLFTDDAIVMATEAPPINGKEELKPIIEGLFTTFDLKLPYKVEEVKVLEGWAFARSNFKYSMTPKGVGETTIREGKELDILKKDADGSWKIYTQCWSYNKPQ